MQSQQFKAQKQNYKLLPANVLKQFLAEAFLRPINSYGWLKTSKYKEKVIYVL